MPLSARRRVGRAAFVVIAAVVERKLFKAAKSDPQRCTIDPMQRHRVGTVDAGLA